jgi:CRP-like cAMP-binding protein
LVTEEPAIGLKLGLTLGHGIAQFQAYLAQRLINIRLFDNLSEPARDVLTQRLTPQRYIPGEVLFRSQDPPTGIFLIQRGKITMQDQFGEVRAELSPGNTLGERAVVYNQLHLYTAVAATETIAWLLSPADFFELREIQPDMVSAIQQNVSGVIAEDLAAAARIISAKIDSLRVVGGSHHPMLKQLENVQHTLHWCRNIQPGHSRPPS